MTVRAAESMGGFNYKFRRAADPTLPLPARYLMFIQACSAFGRLTGAKLQPVHDALGRRYGFSRDRKPDGVQLTLALNAMACVRYRLLHLLADTRARKRRRARQGDRRKLPKPFTASDVLDMLSAFGCPAST